VVYGESDADGNEVKDNPVREGDFFATIYHALSVDPTTENLAGVRPSRWPRSVESRKRIAGVNMLQPSLKYQLVFEGAWPSA